MIDLKTFRGCGMDFSPLGLERGSGRSDYFCTPKGARIIGWTGVDGIHFCHISRLGEMVFAVDPMGSCGDYVYPVAKSLQDFLRLILACGSTAPVQQARGWSGEQFDAFLRENPPTEEMTAALQRLGETFALKPMKQPLAYIQKVQAGFDGSAIPRRAEYWDFVQEEPVTPEWAVYFFGNFWGHSGRERSGQELRGMFPLPTSAPAGLCWTFARKWSRRGCSAILKSGWTLKRLAARKRRNSVSRPKRKIP